jgi:hypothetical protein
MLMREPAAKPKLAPAEYAARFAAEKAHQQRRYCDAFALWRGCQRKACRRHRVCRGDASTCLKRALDAVPRQAQWQVRQDILAATPANLGAPERAVRQCMPGDLYETNGASAIVSTVRQAGRPHNKSERPEPEQQFE